MGSDRPELRCSTETSSASGHHSRFACPRVPVNGHFVLSSMIFSRGVAILDRIGSNVSGATHQVKLIFVIGSIRLSDDKPLAPSTPVFRCAGSAWSFRPRGRILLHFAAGVIDADQGNGRSA